MDIGSGLVGNGPAPVEIGVPAELAQNRPDAASVFFETLAPGRGGLAGVTFALQDNNGNPPSVLTMYQFRSTFAAQLVQADGQAAYTYGIKTVVIAGAGGAGAADMSYACNWHLVGVAPSASEAANLAQSLVGFVAVMPQDNWDPQAMAKEPGYLGSWALDPSVAEEIAIGTTTGQFPAVHSVSANFEKSKFSFFSGQTQPGSVASAYWDCFGECMVQQFVPMWDQFLSCINFAGGAGGAAAGLCVLGCLLATPAGYIPCVTTCLTGVGIGAGVISGYCWVRLMAKFDGAVIGCAIGCW